jgi:hypothetical protein
VGGPGGISTYASLKPSSDANLGQAKRRDWRENFLEPTDPIHSGQQESGGQLDVDGALLFLRLTNNFSVRLTGVCSFFVPYVFFQSVLVARQACWDQQK